MRRYFAGTLTTVFCFLLNGPIHAGEIYSDKSRGFAVEIPDRWVSVSPTVVTQINHAIATFTKSTVSYQACFVPNGHTSSELPRILVQIQPWDNGVPTYDALEESLKRDIPAAMNKAKKDSGAAIGSLDIGDMILDRKANRLTVRMQVSVPGDGMVQGLSIGMLGRDGIVFLHCYSRLDRFPRTVPLFEVFVDSFHFSPGQGYDPSMATVKTMSTRSGGKSSSFSWMGSLRGGTIGGIIGAGVGLMALASRYFRRRTASTTVVQ